MTTTRLIAATATLAAALGVASAVSAAPQVSHAACGTFTGPMWTLVDPFKDPVNQTGTMWKVQWNGVTCAFAQKWAKKLVKTPFKGEALTKFRKKDVPKGWTCRAGGGLTGGGVGTPGQCNLGKKMIFWAPKYP
jgi:hypothetical protein